MKPSVILEFYTKGKGKKIDGLLAIPRISRKGNLYLPEELAKGDGVTVPVLMDHVGTAQTKDELPIKESHIVGYSTLKYDPTLMQLRYEGELTEDIPADKEMQVSLGALPSKIEHVCGTTRCYDIPRGLSYTEMSLTYNSQPGIPESTFNITESFESKQCGCTAKTEAGDDELQACVQKKIAAHGGEPTEQELAIKYSECRKELGMKEESKTESIKPRPVVVTVKLA